MMTVAESIRRAETARAVATNQPSIEVNQVWGGTARRIRILAEHPDKDRHGKRRFIYEELGGGTLRTEIGRLGICPEFNLRYVFELES